MSVDLEARSARVSVVTPAFVGEPTGQGAHDGGFRPDVEGLRAIAVGLVVLFHASMFGVSAGYVGVDVFFVVSGFVITRVLFRELNEAGHVSVLRFYAKRARRILPAATLVVVATAVATRVILGPYAGVLVAEDGRWAALFSANIRFALLGSSYLASQQQPSPLQHMWSLGVEEQFYLVWPLLLGILAVRIRNAGTVRVRAASLLLLAIVASYAWSIFATAQNGTLAYFSPLTRACELSLGALVAISGPLLPQIRSWVCNLGVAAGVLLILLSAMLFDRSTVWPGAAVLLPTGATAAVVLFGGMQEAGTARAVLGARPLRWLGSRSYSLYLWHWPVLILAAERSGVEHLPPLPTVGLIGLAILLAELSYRFVENPIRQSGWLRSRPKASLALGISCVSASVVLMAILIEFSGALPTI